MKPVIKKVVLAYSGGLDTSVIVPWLRENYGCEVICFCANIGQGDDDLAGLEQKALASGASKVYVEDLRHEFTHGLLHATLQTVPLWLDEGLAEYFEVNAALPGAAHISHLRELKLAESEGWNPNLYRLEMLTDFRDLTSRDYAESWAWVHYMLNSSDESSAILVKYVEELQNTRTPRRIMPSLETEVPNYVSDLNSHIRKLQPSMGVAISP